MGVKNGFREFYEVWKKRDLLRELFEDAADVLSEGERMYSAACNALLHGKQPEFDLEDIDQDINEAKSKIMPQLSFALNVFPSMWFRAPSTHRPWPGGMSKPQSVAMLLRMRLSVLPASKWIPFVSA